MKNLKFISGVNLMVCFLFSTITTQAQNEVKLGVPAHNISDTGKIFQDTSNARVWSYRNAELGTQKLKFDYEVTSKTAIDTMNLPVDAKVTIIPSCAIYIVRNDSISDWASDGSLQIKTKNGNYAILQPRDRGYYIEDFGAIPNDALGDSKAIQNAVDAVIAVSSKLKLNQSSQLNAGAGIFTIDTGIVIANPKSDGEYNDITFTLSGSISCYANGASANGSVTEFHMTDSTFCIAVQKGRQVVIENIVFYGWADYTYLGMPTLVTLKDEDWGAARKARTNQYAPSCAIAIDPFHKNMSTTNQYPNFSSYYTNLSSGGTSMLTIRGCSFINHYIAISNNSSNGVKNGDNVRVENSHVKTCKIFWACGQTQSRGNSIDNIYAINVHTLVDNGTIGTKYGTAPTISNVNLSGSKTVFNLASQFTPHRINNCYFENIWSLGYIYGNTVTFNQCQIKFRATEDVFKPPWHLNAGNTTLDFNGCSIEYFNNGLTDMPFYFSSAWLTLNACYTEGGMIFSNGITNTGKVHSVNFNNVNGFRGTRLSRTYNAALNGVYLMGGDEHTTDISGVRTVYKNENDLYDRMKIAGGAPFLDIDSTNYTASFKTNYPGFFKLEDNLLTTSFYTKDSMNMGVHNVSNMPAMIGYISAIDTDSVVTISGIPYGLDEKNYTLNIVRIPQFMYPVLGDFIYNSDTIKNVIFKEIPLVGSRIHSEATYPGTYIVSVNTTDSIIVMSAKASNTKIRHRFYDADYRQTIYVDQWPLPGTTKLSIQEGAIVYLRKPTATYYGYLCEKGGVINATDTTDRPTFHGLTY